MQVGDHLQLVQAFDADIDFLNQLLVLENKVFTTHLSDSRQCDQISIDQRMDQVSKELKKRESPLLICDGYIVVLNFQIAFLDKVVHFF